MFQREGEMCLETQSRDSRAKTEEHRSKMKDEHSQGKSGEPSQRRWQVT